MTKNEALKAAIDGKKIRCSVWPNQDAHIFWDGTRFIHHAGTQFGFAEANSQLMVSDDAVWDIAPEPSCDFPKALTAYRNGYVIESESGYLYSIRDQNSELTSVPFKRLLGKWYIRGNAGEAK